MRTRITALAALALVGLAHAAAGSSAPPSAALQAKHAQATQVLAQVNALDTRFGAVVDAWDGAKIQLATTEKQLAANRAQLSFAQKQSRIAQRHAARLLITIYEGENPDLIQLLAGSSQLSDVINAVQYTRDVATSAQRVAAAAVRARNRLAAAKEQLQTTERARRATVAQLNGERASIGAMLAQRRRLLSSIQSQIAQIQAREAAQQAAAAAAARARLAREAALLKQQAAQRARAAAAAQAVHQAAAPTTSTAPAATTTAPLAIAPATTSTPPPLSGGHPEAASIALQYLGIPYQWGGASPDTGFDCSGLVMYVYAQLGVQLPHFAAGQYGYGSPVGRDQLQPGDLVFFDGLSHVGIYIGNDQVVHAPHTGTVVSISPLSEFGGRYVGARRV
ncbi:MAG TPA: C40 family peptidase [Gaiellaceae bacterium]|jgi:cell wall-associated NlpC family hydrolase|nr:C40 family peptidase [Gaiellaceae bacterium]